MGFGVLMIGYVIAFVFSMSEVYFFADIIGGVVMLYGLTKLSRYGKNFERALWVNLVYLFFCACRAVLMLLGVLSSGTWMATAFSVAVLLITLVYHFFLLAALYYISLSVDLKKEAAHAKRNLIMIFTYYPMYIIFLLLAPLFSETVQHILSVILLLYGIAVVLLNIGLLHSCYCRICIQGQEHGEYTPSRFHWVNEWRELSNRVYEPKKKEKSASEKAEPEPGYLRVKRKKQRK